MADSPLSDTLDELLNNDDDDDESSPSDEDDQSNESSFPTAEIISNNGLKMKIKKRKLDSSSDGKDTTTTKKKKKKKSKSQPSYKRRNIRTLLTNDKLQDDTLSALKAEQDRLKRLEETNHQPLPTTYTHLPPIFYQPSTIPKSQEDECIVLDDDEGEDKNGDVLPPPLSKSELDPGWKMIFLIEMKD